MLGKFQGRRSPAGYTVHGVTRNGQNLVTKPHQHHPILAPDSHQSVLYNSAISRMLYKWNHICNLLGLGFSLSMILWRVVQGVLCVNSFFKTHTHTPHTHTHTHTPTDCFSLSPVHLQNKVNKNKSYLLEQHSSTLICTRGSCENKNSEYPSEVEPETVFLTSSQMIQMMLVLGTHFE